MRQISAAGSLSRRFFQYGTSRLGEAAEMTALMDAPLLTIMLRASKLTTSNKKGYRHHG